MQHIQANRSDGVTCGLDPETERPHPPPDEPIPSPPAGNIPQEWQAFLGHKWALASDESPCRLGVQASQMPPPGHAAEWLHTSKGP